MESRRANWNLQNPSETEKFFEKMQNSLETANNLETAKRSGKCETLTLFDMGGGHDGPPKMFLTTVPKGFGGGSWNLVTFNINLWGYQKKLFLVA